MAEYVKTVTRALGLLEAVGEVSKHHQFSKDADVDDCANWVVAQVEATIDGLAGIERIDAESVELALALINDMEREAKSELLLAKRGMTCEDLEREKWLPQRVAELEAGLDDAALARS